MKSPYVTELQPNQIVTALFLVTFKDIRQKKTGEPYLSLTLSDRTGDLDAKMWDNVEEVMETFGRDDFVRVRGLAQIHQNRLQLTIQKLQKVEESTVEFADFFPASRRDPQEMMAEARRIFEALGNPDLRALAMAFLDDAEIARLLRTAPAAKTMHHAYLGGLIEHMLSMCHLALMAGPHYGVDGDLLLTGVLLHDIGKIYELSYDRSFGYTIEGHLLGHMVIALRMLDAKIRTLPEFPAHLRLLLEHMILSHHGTLEFGSPKVPLFPEALLLHHLDNLDSKMEAMRHSLEKDRTLEGYFTGYNPALERQVFKKEKYLQTAQPNGSPEPVKPAGGAAQPDTRTAAPPPPPNPNAARRQPSISPFAEQLRKALKP